ncbi:unnamed protein product [Caenorhabditis sp. 36 PRJEB53466]|nr:unnamed protein product [Caenorhabditis sp. 36 PRJEB53466]
MFAVPFLSSLTSLLGTTAIDDSVDTLSCLVTAFIFIIGAIAVSAKGSVGSAIECWLPQTYSGEWGEYAENYCFLKDTYWYPSAEPMNDIPEFHKEKHRLGYYQWTSMYLTVAGLVFMLPKFLWKFSQSATDLPLSYFCDTTNEIRRKNTEERAVKVKEMAKFMRDKLNVKHSKHSLSSVHMHVAYAFTKCFYLLVAFGQFVFIGYFIGQTSDLFWGYTLFHNLMSGITWETTGLFPRVTFCDFTIREMAGNIREETIQCVVGVNEFNEKIFLFLWFWLAALNFITLLSTVYAFVQIKKTLIVNNILQSIRRPGDHEQKMLFKEFADNYLTTDGKLILNFVKAQSDLVAQELALEMFDNFENERKEKMLDDATSIISGSKMASIDKLRNV